MKSDFPTKNTIRQYLLGQLNDQHELEMRLSQQMLFNDEVSETVDSVEDEIIEEYLDGNVSPDDRVAIEEYFLAPAERKEKLLLARLLRNHFDSATGAADKKKLGAPSELAPTIRTNDARPLPKHWPVQIRTWCEIAAAIILIVSGLIYISQVRGRLQAQLDVSRRSQMRVEDELAQERERSASLTRQLEEARPSMAALVFLGSILRANGSIPIVEIKPWTQRIRVEVDLQDAPAGTYDLQLENREGKTIWSQSGITASSGGLRFEMPTQGLTTGAYCFVVSSRPKHYCFQARVAKN